MFHNLTTFSHAPKNSRERQLVLISVLPNNKVELLNNP